MAGTCYGVEPPDGSGVGVDFSMLGPDGSPLGRTVHVVGGSFRVLPTNCAVAASELGFLVAWWDGNALWVRSVGLPD